MFTRNTPQQSWSLSIQRNFVIISGWLIVRSWYFAIKNLLNFFVKTGTIILREWKKIVWSSVSRSNFRVLNKLALCRARKTLANLRKGDYGLWRIKGANLRRSLMSFRNLVVQAFVNFYRLSPYRKLIKVSQLSEPTEAYTIRTLCFGCEAYKIIINIYFI